jgi:glycosyltransferase involved in cell wall biosynthesis
MPGRLRTILADDPAFRHQNFQFSSHPAIDRQNCKPMSADKFRPNRDVPKINPPLEGLAVTRDAQRTEDMETAVSLGKVKIAIVHDWLPLYGGAERVLERILQVFPSADLFSMIDAIPEGQRDFLLNKPVRTSIVQRLPGGKKWYRHYLPIMPMAVEQFVLRDYNLVISSSYAVAKGVLTGPNQLHICYCHSPIRYAWDLQSQYLEEGRLNGNAKGWLTKALLHYIRLWDFRTSTGVDYFVANSRFVSRRIRKVYRRDSTVIHPPVDVEKFTLHEAKEGFYLTASRMVPYKRMELIVEAFSRMPERRLKVVGDGPDMKKLRRKAKPNVELLGYQKDEVLRDLMQRARAFVFAAEEDFGIMTVEAQACGTPVIAYGSGGSLETVLPDVTGVFFESQTVESLCAAVSEFEHTLCSFDPAVIRRHAEAFSVARFKKEFADFVNARWQEFQSDLVIPSAGTRPH